MDPKRNLASLSILQRDLEDLQKFRLTLLEAIPEISPVPPASRQRSSPEQLRENTLYKLTPLALGTEQSSLLSFTISSGRKEFSWPLGQNIKTRPHKAGLRRRAQAKNNTLLSPLFFLEPQHLFPVRRRRRRRGDQSLMTLCPLARTGALQAGSQRKLFLD